MNENTAVATEQDRTPDPIATIQPFRHPWIAGDDSCGECGQFFRDHWWADAGDHGHTVCDLPQADDVWVEVDSGGTALNDLPEGARVRSEWAMGIEDSTRLFVHRDDMPDPDKETIECMAKAIFASDSHSDGWEAQIEDLREVYRKTARAALAAYLKEGD